MTEHFGFFDAVQDSNGNYDREYNAEQFTVPFDALVTNGIVRSAYEQLEVVTSGSNMISRVKSGIAFIEGHHYFNDGIINLTHDVEVLGMDRIDRIVIRKDSNPDARYVKAFIRKGLPSTNPVPPTLTRNENIYEISLAQVRIVGGQGFISTITDERGTVNIGPWAGSDILPSYDDNLLAQHVNNGEIHVTQTQKNIWDNKVFENGLFISGSVNFDNLEWNKISQVGDVTSAQNAPPVSYGILITNKPTNSGFGFQRFVKHDIEYLRFHSNGTWSAWKRILTETDYNTLFQSVSNGKAAIANAVTQRGVPTAANAEFATMAANILNLTGFATGTRTVNQGGALSVEGLTFEPKVVIGFNQATGKHLYFERLTDIGIGYVVGVLDYGIPDGVTGDTQATIRKRSAVTVTATSISIPVVDGGTYTFYIYG